MNRYDLITPEGTRDLLFEECAAVKSVERRLLGIFSMRGFSEVVTPGLEFYDVFDLKSRYFPPETMYKLVDNKARLMVVRPDSTMPIARMTATRLAAQELPIRLCYSQSVYRNRPSMRGRRDEIRQTGIEIIGSADRRADLEMLSEALEALDSFKTGSSRLELGHIGFFKALLSRLDCDADTKEEIRSLIEFKNFPALGDLLDSIDDPADAAALRQLPRLFGGEEVFEKARLLIGADNAEAENALAELEDIYTQAKALGYSGEITVDLGLVNRMDYYTGIVVKGYIEDVGDAVLSGGRYDRLLSEFGLDMPATGFAVNTDSVARAEMKYADYSVKPVDVIVYGDSAHIPEALTHIKALTAQGLRAESALFGDPEDVREYARSKGIKRIDTVTDTVVTENI